VILIVAVWIWVDRLLGSTARNDTAAAQFLSKMNVAFALIAASGLFGVANGWTMAHSGRRNWPLVIGVIVTFTAGLVIAVVASSGYQPR
jgi:F0F1-type ATP synthase assembly protein I